MRPRYFSRQSLSFLRVSLILLFEKKSCAFFFQHWRQSFRKMTSLSKSDTPDTVVDPPQWCPKQQIYIGGKLPEDEEFQAFLKESRNDGMRVFGYGSLCWSPGTVLSKEGIIAKPGFANGYRRFWAQKSTDHRGNPQFPGIVCTLLKDSELSFSGAQDGRTGGVIYWIPPDFVDECLQELDFRERGGYSREVITVAEDKQMSDQEGQQHKALLYRGTPDNPAFWDRALLDLPFCAAVLSVSKGPSGSNDVYLNQLNEFLLEYKSADREKDDTTTLANMVQYFQQHSNLYFMYGSGSNQHNQLLLYSDNNAASLENEEDAHESKEMVLCTSRWGEKNYDPPTNIFAGGGHSGLLTKSGKLYLWGWNEDGQCSDRDNDAEQEVLSPLPTVNPLLQTVETAALGFSHTLVIEIDSKKVLAFGNNERGQVNGKRSSTPQTKPQTPDILANDRVVAVAAGLFHSAVITQEGELVTFGCGRFGQSIVGNNGRWKPKDNVKLVDVACGRRHTVAIDALGRVWSFGENKYGQLGRYIDGNKKDPIPTLLEGFGPSCRALCVYSGWSHTVLKVECDDTTQYYGWGRNDKGQLGTGTKDHVQLPAELFQDYEISTVSCGNESTMAVAQSSNILGCGWNEHGNLATRDAKDQLLLTETLGVKVGVPPSFPGLQDGDIAIAVGGAHYFATKVIYTQ
jgi:alpha-tubulin suppressor-like RCC1 family protein